MAHCAVCPLSSETGDLPAARPTCRQEWNRRRHPLGEIQLPRTSAARTASAFYAGASAPESAISAEMRRERPRLWRANTHPLVPAGSLTPHWSVSATKRAHLQAASIPLRRMVIRGALGSYGKNGPKIGA